MSSQSGRSTLCEVKIYVAFIPFAMRARREPELPAQPRRPVVSFSIGAITAKPPRLEFRYQLLTVRGGALPLFEVFGDDLHPAHQMLV